MKRLRKSDIRQLSDELPVDLDKRDDVQTDGTAVLVNEAFWFFRPEGEDGWIPAIPLLLAQPDVLPRLVVDMGAVRHVARGADIMRPGITEVPDAPEGALVQVVDEQNRKPLAVGRLLASGADIRGRDSGRVVQTVHFVGDKLWQRYFDA